MPYADRCRNGHPKNKSNTHRGRCRRCKAINARRYRAEGKQFGRPERRAERYCKNREAELGLGRARYHANKKKYCALRRINRLRKKEDVSDYLGHIADLLREVSALKTVAVSTARPKVRFVRGI